MKRLLAIAWKDLNINFRDRNALLLMIVAPLLLSAIIGVSFGGLFSGDSATPFDSIPTLLVNADEGELGQQFAAVLRSDDLADLLLVTEMDDLAAARELVQAGEARTAVYIPADFTAVIQNQDGTAPAHTLVQFYADPSATITPNIVRGIVLQIVNQFNSGAISAQVTVEQLLAQADALGPALANLEPVLEDSLAAQFSAEPTAVIRLNEISTVEEEEEEVRDISPFAFFAPSMGILFLMFSMMEITRSILDEERDGTLDRLLTTPLSHRELLAGKVGGVFFSGIVQFFIFVIASKLLFQLDWGRSLDGLVLMVVAIVAAFTGLGLLIAAFAKDVNQAAIIGSVVSLTFAALGGNFIAAENFPPWLELVSKITINRWGLDGLIDLTIYGGGLSDILPEAAVLFGLAALFFVLALTQFERRISK